ncbi:TrkA C-terminal domain-containing protein [Clostridiaceae bacterium M8S5]|nr:TrkA C-terminal domain-containing protein [Clostridiaceae bacterium M8S5]
MKKKVSMPRYIKIALDIAYSIINGDLKIGTKVSGRSTLASKYNVSPETIRRAIALLRDMNVVEVSEKSGINILSVEQAHSFVNYFNVKNDVLRLKHDTEKLLNDKKDLENQILDNINSIIEYSSQFKNIGLIYTMELTIPKSSKIVHETISSSAFWQNTGATILGIKRDKQLIISPGPHFTFLEEDIILFVGQDGVFDKVKDFIGVQNQN